MTAFLVRAIAGCLRDMAEIVTVDEIDHRELLVKDADGDQHRVLVEVA